MKTDKNRALAKGQIWRTRVAHIEILALGQRLIHYRITKQLGLKWVSSQISSIEAMADYLKRNAAELIRGCVPQLSPVQSTGPMARGGVCVDDGR